MKKHKKKIIWLIILGGLGFGLFYVYQRFAVITGYAAKNMCSCVFLAGRDEKTTIDEELNFSYIKYTNVEVDTVAQKVTATLLGLGAKTAYFHPQKGCALLEEEEVAEFKKKIPEIISLHENSNNLKTNSDNVAIDYGKLNTVISNQFVDVDKEKPYGTRAIVVLYKGEIIGEKYAEGFDTTSLHLGWSMAKSVFSALIGVAIEDKLISSVNNDQLFNEWTDERKSITLKNLLQMNSGIDWEENYANLSGVTLMLYKEANMVDFVKSRSIEGKAGEHFEYSSGSSNLLSGYLRTQFKTYEEYFKFPYQRLFSRIGANSFKLETDAKGNFVASSYAWATARDWAKFGLLYLNNGKVGEEQIFSEEWTKFSREPAAGSDNGYAAQFWLPTKKEYPDSPKDMFFADGFQGQRIFIIPSKDVVIVRMAVSRFEQPDYNDLVKDVLASIIE
jgi:CubicO group peptidase (beta-lactamase class C family)